MACGRASVCDFNTMPTAESVQAPKRVIVRFVSKSTCNDSGRDFCITNDSQSNKMAKVTGSGGCKKRKPDTILDSQKLKRRKMDRGIKLKCGQILKDLLRHPSGWVFSKPVDPVALKIPDYFDIISDPMDLGTIKSKLENNEYSCAEEFASDVNLTFANAMRYNPPTNEVNHMARNLDRMFRTRWKLVVDKWNHESSSVDGEIIQTESCKYANDKTQHYGGKSSSDTAVQMKKSMALEEKKELLKELMKMLGGKVPEKLWNILRSSNLVGLKDGKINFDVETCDDSTWLELSTLLKHSVRAVSPQVIPKKANTGRPVLPGKIAHKGSSGSVDGKPPMSSNSSKCHSCGGMRCRCGLQTKNALRSSAEKSSQGQSLGTRVDVQKNVSTAHASTSCHDSNCFGNAKDDEKTATSPDMSPSYAASTSDEGWTRLDDQCSLEKAQRVAMLRSRFAETILKANGKSDPKKIQEEKERLERLQQEEEAKIKARMEEEQLKRKMQLDMARQAARSALEMVERTIKVDDNLKSLRELETLCQRSSSRNLYVDSFRRHLQLIGLVLKNDLSENEEDRFLCGDWEEGEILS